MHLFRLFLLLSLFLSLSSACSVFTKEEDVDTRGQIESEVYAKAIRSLRTGQARNAVSYLQALEAQFPFGPYAEQSQLEIIYAYFLARDFEASKAAAQRFIRLHPDHNSIDYAHYMLGVISFTENASFIGSMLPIDITDRDPGSARESFAFFSELLLRYPDSIYGPDARKRLIFLRNLLARKEINAANYYFKRGAYLAAINRGKYVVENFQKTPAVADGLAVMAQGYSIMGYEELSNNAMVVLKDNYPNHPSILSNGEFKYKSIKGSDYKRSFLNKLTLGLLDPPSKLGFDTRAIYNTEYNESAE